MSVMVYCGTDSMSSVVGYSERVLGFVAHVCEIASVPVEKESTRSGYGAHEAGGVSGTY